MSAQKNNQNVIFRNSAVGGSVPLEIAPLNVQVSAVSTASNVTLTTNDILGGLILRDCAAANRSDSCPSASDLVVALGGSYVPAGQSFVFRVKNVTASGNSVTLAGGNGVSFSGSAAVAQNEIKSFLGVVNAPNSVTVYNLGSADFTA